MKSRVRKPTKVNDGSSGAAAVQPPLAVACICPHCGKVFNPFDMGGDWLSRTCPACKKIIASEDYDALAQHLFQQLADERVKFEKAQQEFDRASLLLKVCRIWPLRLFKGPAERYQASKGKKRQAIKEEIQSINRRLGYAAKDRYYTSEWFHSTHIPLKRTGEMSYDLHPYYDGKARWQMPRGNKAGRGSRSFIAEHQVYSALLAETKDTSSPLYGACVAPNLYLPRDQRRNKQGRLVGRFWDQVDTVLLTKRAAFVIEVKTRSNDHVVANAPFETIYSSADSKKLPFDETSESFEEDWVTSCTSALSQNSQHAVSFDRECKLYPFEAVYEQVVFANVPAFSCDCQSFIENVNVSASLRSNPSMFIEVIKNEYSKLEDRVDDCQVREEAKRLITSYGDLNQKRAEVHRNRIKNLSYAS